MIFGQSLFWFALALLFALVEIEAEGKHGRAEKMPTWYRTTGLAARLYGAVMDAKPLTGYHLFMFFIPLLIAHVPFFSGTRWSVAAECAQLALFFAWCVAWDYLWFILNPHYGVKLFSKDSVWWHAQSG